MGRCVGLFDNIQIWELWKNRVEIVTAVNTYIRTRMTLWSDDQACVCVIGMSLITRILLSVIGQTLESFSTSYRVRLWFHKNKLVLQRRRLVPIVALGVVVS